jgi:hypothetical protein
MACIERLAQEIKFTFLNGATVSDTFQAEAGAVAGTIIVPAGSALIGKTLQFVATHPSGLYADTDLLTTPKTLALGSNSLSAAELLQMGMVNFLKLKINTAVGADSPCVFLWKS